MFREWQHRHGALRSLHGALWIWIFLNILITECISRLAVGHCFVLEDRLYISTHSLRILAVRAIKVEYIPFFWQFKSGGSLMDHTTSSTLALPNRVGDKQAAGPQAVSTSLSGIMAGKQQQPIQIFQTIMCQFFHHIFKLVFPRIELERPLIWQGS